MKDLADFAAKTPFQLADLAKAEQKLISFGFSVEKSKELLSDLGDVAAASGSDIQDISLIFGQVSAAGKLTGERLLQLQERAIPIGPALAKTMGVAESAVRELVTQGKVSFADFEKAFTSLNDKGQFAFEGMARRSLTLEGRISTLKDNFDLLQADVGSKLSPTFKALVGTITTVIDKIRQLLSAGALDGLIKSFAENIPKAISFAFDAVQFLIDGFINFVQAVNTIRAAIVAVEIPIIDFAIGFVKAGIAVDKFLNLFTDRSDYIKSQQEFVKNLELLKETAIEQGTALLGANDKLEDSQNSLAKVIQDAKAFTLNAYNKETEAIKANEAADIEATQTKISNAKELTAEQLKAIQDELDAEKKRQEELKALREEGKLLEEAERLTQSEVAQAFRESELEVELAFLEQRDAALLAARLREAQSETEKQIIIQKIKNDSYDKQFKDKENFDKRQIQLEQRTSQARANILSGFFNLAGTLAKQGSKEQFLIQKAGAIAQTIIATNQAAAQALAVPPSPNVGLASLAKAAGGLNLATIVAQTIQGFQNGGVVAGQSFSGDNVLARVNSGEMILNREQQSNLFKIANQGGAGQQEIMVTSIVNLDGEEVARSVSRQVANGFKLGEVV
jgi:tape measure domain-containing protein